LVLHTYILNGYIAVDASAVPCGCVTRWLECVGHGRFLCHWDDGEPLARARVWHPPDRRVAKHLLWLPARQGVFCVCTGVDGAWHVSICSCRCSSCMIQLHWFTSNSCRSEACWFEYHACWILCRPKLCNIQRRITISRHTVPHHTAAHSTSQQHASPHNITRHTRLFAQ